MTRENQSLEQVNRQQIESNNFQNLSIRRVDPLINEALYNEIIGITDHRITKPLYSERILPVPFVDMAWFASRKKFFFYFLKLGLTTEW